MIGRPHRILAAMVVVCVHMMLQPRAVEAQSTTAYRGLFGQRQRDSKRQPSIDFSMSLIDGYDTGGDQLSAGSGDRNPNPVLQRTKARLGPERGHLPHVHLQRF